MTISPFFRHLRTAYQAELDDLLSDSEGSNVLAKRLKDRRGELPFLVKMLELSPEMVAVVLHQGFRFKDAALLDHVLSHESEDLPEWSVVREGLDLAPWTASLVQTILKEPMGQWFLTVAAALEYMHERPAGGVGAQRRDDDDADDDGESTDNDADNQDAMDEDEREARLHEEAGAAWMVEQGFDAKD